MTKYGKFQAWSADQQKALEDALRKHKDANKEEKWDLIAGDVPGKDRKECMQRFKVWLGREGKYLERM